MGVQGVRVASERACRWQGREGTRGCTGTCHCHASGPSCGKANGVGRRLRRRGAPGATGGAARERRDGRDALRCRLPGGPAKGQEQQCPGCHASTSLWHSVCQQQQVAIQGRESRRACVRGVVQSGSCASCVALAWTAPSQLSKLGLEWGSLRRLRSRKGRSSQQGGKRWPHSLLSWQGQGA